MMIIWVVGKFYNELSKNMEKIILQEKFYIFLKIKKKIMNEKKFLLKNIMHKKIKIFII